MWELEYSREASNYALDSYPYNEDVLIAIEALALTEEGIPATNCLPLADMIYVWTVANHQVIFRQLPEPRRLRILAIRPN